MGGLPRWSTPSKDCTAAVEAVLMSIVHGANIQQGQGRIQVIKGSLEDVPSNLLTRCVSCNIPNNAANELLCHHGPDPKAINQSVRFNTGRHLVMVC